LISGRVPVIDQWMGTINLRSSESSSTFLHPRKNFKPVTMKFQVRFDPLTGRTGHFSHFGAIRAQELDLQRYLKPEIKGFCPFCLEGREAYTPKFPEDFTLDGRFSSGEALLIPNLFPYDVHSGIVVITEEHLVPLEGFSEKRVIDALTLGTDFLKKVAGMERTLSYHVGAWNYMPPSGGGLVHPHQQYFATNSPGNQFTDELKASAAFREQHGTDYWTELIREEKERNERYIGSTGRVEWLSSFVSMGILGEILAVIPGCFSIIDLTDETIFDLTRGLRYLFHYFKDAGISSFNAAWFFGPIGQSHFSSHFRIIPRTFLNTRDYAPDLNFFQALLAEPVSVILPEQLCAEVAPYFLRDR
jgi:UDPglucose--hexose-1-phosphate uridylyltransferase